MAALITVSSPRRNSRANNLSANLKEILGNDYLYFFDAAAPIVSDESIDHSKAFFKDRYEKGEADGD